MNKLRQQFAKEVTTIEAEAINRFEDDLDFKRRLTDVEHRIRDNIGSDFVLAKLEEKTKEGVIDLHGMAEYVKQTINRITRRGKIYGWNKEKNEWIVRPLNQQENNYVEELSKLAFDTYMNPLQARAILNRNQTGNYIIDTLVNQQHNTPPEEQTLKEKAAQLKKKEGE